MSIQLESMRKIHLTRQGSAEESLVVCGSFVGLVLILIVMSVAELAIGVQGPVWVHSRLPRHPVMLLDGLVEALYIGATAVLLQHPIGVLSKVCAQLVASGIVRAVLPTLFATAGIASTAAAVEAMHAASPGSIVVGFGLALLGSLLALHGWTMPCYRQSCGRCCPCKCCVDKGYELVLQMDELDDNDDFRLDVEEALAAKADNTLPSPLSSLAMVVAFAALTLSNTAWTTFQVYFHEAFGLDALGFMCLDQIYGSVFTLCLMTVVHSWMPLSAQQDGDPVSGRSFCALVRSTVARSCRHEEHGRSGLLLVIASKVLANGAIVIYVSLSVHGDPSTLIFEMALLKLVFGTLYSLGSALLCGGCIRVSAQERREMLAPRMALGRVVGVAMLLLSLVASRAL